VSCPKEKERGEKGNVSCTASRTLASCVNDNTLDRQKKRRKKKRKEEESNFPKHFQTRDTAYLFLALNHSPAQAHRRRGEKKGGEKNHRKEEIEGKGKKKKGKKKRDVSLYYIFPPTSIMPTR